MSVNKVLLSGRMVADPELRHTGTGTAVVTTRIAVDDGFGENKKTYFPNIVIWKHTAEYIAKYGKKGDMLVVDGRLTIRDYEKDGSKIYVTEIVAEKVELFTSNRSDSDSTENQSDGNSEEISADDFKELEEADDLPF